MTWCCSYLDVDAAGSAANDLAQPLSLSYLEQTEVGGSSVVRYRALSGRYGSYGTSIVRNVALYPSLRNLLNDAFVNDFFPSMGSVGPGDVTAAYQFKRSVEPGTAIVAHVAVTSNMPSRNVKGAAPDLAPFPVLLHNRGTDYRMQVMRRALMVRASSARLQPPRAVPWASPTSTATTRTTSSTATSRPAP